MTNERAAAVGAALRRLRGTRDQTEAARLTGLSRQWWIDNERGMRVARPNKLATAAERLGGDVRQLLELAGYDPAPFIGDDLMPPADDAMYIERLLDRLDVLDGAMRRLEDRVRALEEQDAPPVAGSAR